MKAVRAAGFTLIELLTVIAIISILAGLTMVVIPGVLERAKIVDATADMRSISQSLHTFYTEQGTYPPGYGYQLFDPDAAPNADATYNHHAYTTDIAIDGVLDAYDRFSQDYDTNRNRSLQLLEFIPLPGDRLGPPPDDSWLKRAPEETPYPGGEAVDAFVAEKRARSQRPYVYVPYYKKDIERMKRTAAPGGGKVGENWDGAIWNPDFITDNTIFPPPQYDAFVLLSVGPIQNTRGVVSPPGDENAWLASTGEALPDCAYYVLGMRAAYLATRDANGDGFLDFDYVARRNNGQAKAYPIMPDGRSDLGFAAPIIIKSE